MIYVIVILFATSILTFFGYMYFSRLLLLKDLKVIRIKYLDMQEFLKKNSQETIAILFREYNELKNGLLLINNTINDPPTNSELQAFITKTREEIEDIKVRIIDAKQLWDDYINFRQEVDFKRINLVNKLTKIKDIANQLAKKHRKHQEDIYLKVEGILIEANDLVKRLDFLQLATLEEFAAYLVEDIEEEYKQIVEKCEKTIKEISIFSESIEVYLIRVHRKATFFINLEEITDGSLGGKQTISRIARKSSRKLGERIVSLKTYQEAFDGKRYKGNTFITTKRVAFSQVIELKIKRENQITNHRAEISDNDFERIYSILPIDKKNLLKNEDGYPLEMQTDNLEILVCQKEPLEFTEKYIYDVFEEIGLVNYFNQKESQILLIDK